MRDADGDLRVTAEDGQEHTRVMIFGPVRTSRIAYRKRGKENLYPQDAELNWAAVHSLLGRGGEAGGEGVRDRAVRAGGGAGQRGGRDHARQAAGRGAGDRRRRPTSRRSTPPGGRSRARRGPGC